MTYYKEFYETFHSIIEKLEQKNEKLEERLAIQKVEFEEELRTIKNDIETRTMCIQCEKELENCKLLAKLEKIKEECENIYYFNDESYVSKENILEIIECEE